MAYANAKVFSVVVTYNRKMLLIDCVNALLNQSRSPDCIVIVDNASTDGTYDLLAENGYSINPSIKILRLKENIGGAAGFSKGIQFAMKNDADLMWIMDDDALPETRALENLLQAKIDDQTLLGSVSVAGDMLSWHLTLMGSADSDKKRVQYIYELPECAEVQFIPFLGLLLSRHMVMQIGLPDDSFFISGDDVDYCIRARKSGYTIRIVPSSVIHHPAAEQYLLNLLFTQIWCIRLPPWKRYYDVRNRIVIAKKHFGIGLYTRTFPSLIFRLCGTLFCEDDKLMQIRSFFCGFIDGIFGKRGCRHHLWGL